MCYAGEGQGVFVILVDIYMYYAGEGQGVFVMRTDGLIGYMCMEQYVIKWDHPGNLPSDCSGHTRVIRARASSSSGAPGNFIVGQYHRYVAYI